MWSKFLVQQKIIKLIVEGLTETAKCLMKLLEMRSAIYGTGHEDAQHLKETMKKIQTEMENNDGTV